MMNRPEVSVIIPAFNAERFLGEAIESVLAQSLSAAEILVVDDGSTDNTGLVAAGFPGVTVVSLAHFGVSAARNAGVSRSTGDFIAFLDADDTWMPERLERQFVRLAASPAAGVVMARQTYRFEVPVPSWFRGPTDGSSEPGYQPSNWLVRRETWTRVGPFTEGITHSEDTDWLARASDLGVEVVMADEVLVVHRIHEQNASGQAEAVRAGVLHALRTSVRRKQGMVPEGGLP